MILLEIKTRVLKCHILDKDHTGKKVCIFKINKDPSKENLPFKLCCLQFSIHFASVMTINKAQEQSIVNVGMNLHTSVFSHG
jgi:hypothetical protein